MLDKNPFTISEFKGIDRGSNDTQYTIETADGIPFSAASDALNIAYTKEGGIRCRPALKSRQVLTDFITTGDFARQHWKISRLGTTYYTNRWFYLVYSIISDTGSFFDTGSATPDIPVLGIAGCKYASVINIYGRLYISPLSDFGVPLAASSVYLYDGSTSRVAGGTRPSVGSMAVANAVVAGANVTAGYHLCAIAFETDSGYITPPITPATWLNITAPGGQAVAFSNIPVGPAGTAARHLLMTKTVINYDGIPENWEMFFGLRIPNNTATTGNIVVPDTGLVNSASYLLDEFETIPSCSSLSTYRSHLMYNGPRTDQRLVYVSKPSDPESIDQTEDYLQLYDGLPVEVFTGRELRGIYYMFKETSTFVTREDVNVPPNEWSIDLVDSGLGCGPFGIAEVMANPGGLVLDNLITCGMAGIYLFTGTYSHVPLSRKIQSLFQGELTRADIKFSRLAVDPIRRRIYIVFGEPDVDEDKNRNLYVGDYFNGLDPESIKWARWTFTIEKDDPT